jgi:hypothetical protein
MADCAFKFARFDTVGSADAETDREFLSECFVDLNYVRQLVRPESSRRIVVGRTGSGKSALLLRLAEGEKHAIFIYPEQLALSHVSNSTVLRYLADKGVNFELFFKLLWTHVLAISLIREKFGIESEADSVGRLARIFESDASRKRRTTIEYLQNWGSRFWVETDYNVRQVTSKLEADLKSNLGLEFSPVTAGFRVGASIEEGQTVDVVQRAQSVVNRVQIEDLNRVIQMLDDLLDDPQQHYYLLVDKLDEDWVEDSFRYRLIRALVETTRTFNDIRHARLIIALRDDLLYRVFSQTRSSGFQAEKYESRMMHVAWTRNDLKELLDQRVQHLVKRRYTQQPVHLKDIFSGLVNGNEDPVEYIIDRTLLRPRDAIKFLNCIIEKAEGKAEILQTMVKDAELDYSKSRLRALADEWYGDYKTLPRVFDLLRNKNQHLRVGDITEEMVQVMAESVFQDVSAEQQNCRIYVQAYRLLDSKLTLVEMRQWVVWVMYEIGLIWIRCHTGEPFLHSMDHPGAVSSASISADSTMSVHKAFWRALNISPDR